MKDGLSLLDSLFLKRIIIFLVIIFIIFGVGISLAELDNFNKAKSILSKLNFYKAEVANQSPLFDFENKNNNLFLAEEIKGQESEQIILAEQEIKKEIKDVLEISEIQEILDDISEQIDILSQEVFNLSEKYSDNNKTDEPAPEEENIEKQDDKNRGFFIKTKIEPPAIEEESIADKIKGKKFKKMVIRQEASGGGSGGGNKKNAYLNYCSKNPQDIPLKDKVIFNEIAWMGTSNSSNDEWMELKNITDSPSNLSGWQILDKQTQIKIVFEEKDIISPAGFYLLERTDNNTIPDIPSDFVYKGALNDNNEELYLFDNNCLLQDEIISEKQWPAGDKKEKRTMERGEDLIWHTYSGEGANGIMGTPKQENSQPSQEPEEPEEPIEIDNLAPQVEFDLEPVYNVLSFSVNFEIFDRAQENVTPSGLAGFFFRWKEENGDWQEDEEQEILDALLKYSGQREFVGQDRKTYYFQIKAEDKAQNESVWLTETPAFALIDIPKKIMINEIQIDGKIGSGGSNDDWLELYNPNDFDVCLDGSSIQEHSASEPCSLDKSFYKKNFSQDNIIPAKGFFLIVDTEADDELKNIADMTIGWSLTGGNTVYLVKDKDKIESDMDSDIIDKVGWGQACFFEGNPADEPTEEKSIERKELGLDTDNNSADFKVKDEPSPTNSFGETLIKEQP